MVASSEIFFVQISLASSHYTDPGGGGGGGGRGEGECYKFPFVSRNEEESRFGLAVRRLAGKRKDLGSTPLRLSFLFRKDVVCGHCLVTLSITSY